MNVNRWLTVAAVVVVWVAARFVGRVLADAEADAYEMDEPWRVLP